MAMGSLAVLLGCTDVPPTPASVPAPAAPAPAAVAPQDRYSPAVGFVFPEGPPLAVAACKAEEDPVPCLLRARLGADPAALDLALGMYTQQNVVVGVIREHTFDGGWRGPVHLVPRDPIGDDRVHLQWVSAAFTDYDAWAAKLAERAPDHQVDFRVHPTVVRFFRSVDRRTPSAYAIGWELAYNVAGSINTSEERVRETLFHELFHTNDQAHGGWSARELTPLWEAIRARCGQDTACLRPYAPARTRVTGGTYYAFQAGNGVEEYGAELAIRYYLEQRAALAGAADPGPRFACLTAENREAWSALVAEFFHVDFGVPCGD